MSFRYVHEFAHAKRVAAVAYAVTLYWSGYRIGFAYRAVGNKFGVSPATIRRWHNKVVPIDGLDRLIDDIASKPLLKARAR